MSHPELSREQTRSWRGAASYIARRWREEIGFIAMEARAWRARDDGRAGIVRIESGNLRFLDAAGIESVLSGALEESDPGSSEMSGTRPSNDVILELAQGDVLRARLTLPNASPWTLRNMLRYELVRLTPADPSELYFDFRIVGSRGKLCELELRIVKRKTIDRAIALCQAANLHVGMIRFDTDPKPADWFALPVDRLAFARLIWRRWHMLMLGATALILALLFVMAVYARAGARSEAVSAALELEKSRALLVERLQHKTATAIGESTFVVRAKSAPLFVEILADLSKALPDDAWITELSLSGDHLRLVGYSQSASDLISRFDRSTRFGNAQFTAPLTRDEQTKAEHFELALDVTRP